MTFSLHQGGVIVSNQTTHAYTYTIYIWPYMLMAINYWWAGCPVKYHCWGSNWGVSVWPWALNHKKSVGIIRGFFVVKCWHPGTFTYNRIGTGGISGGVFGGRKSTYSNVLEPGHCLDMTLKICKYTSYSWCWAKCYILHTPRILMFNLWMIT